MIMKKLRIFLTTTGIILYFVGAFLFISQPASAIVLQNSDCDCMGLKGVWVDGSCYLRANYEYCSVGNYYKMVKKCTKIAEAGPSACDCSDEDLCTPELP